MCAVWESLLRQSKHAAPCSEDGKSLGWERLVVFALLVVKWRLKSSLLQGHCAERRRIHALLQYIHVYRDKFILFSPNFILLYQTHHLFLHLNIGLLSHKKTPKTKPKPQTIGWIQIMEYREFWACCSHNWAVTTGNPQFTKNIIVHSTEQCWTVAEPGQQ